MEPLPFAGLSVREGIQENGVLCYVDVGLILGIQQLFGSHVFINNGLDLDLSKEISWAKGSRHYVESCCLDRGYCCTHSLPFSLKNGTLPMCGFQRRVTWSSRSLSLTFSSTWRSRSSLLSFFSSASFTVSWCGRSLTLGCNGLTPMRHLSERKPGRSNPVHTSDNNLSFGFLNLDQSLFGTRLEERGQRFVARMLDVHWGAGGGNFPEGSVR